MSRLASTMPSSVLVIGAGELGEAVLRRLSSHPARSTTQIDVLMRPTSINSDDETKKKLLADIKALGVNPVHGDILLDDHEQLASIFGKYHTVIGCSGMTYPPGTQLKITKAVLASGCQRYFPWQYGLDYDIIGRDSAQDLFTEQLDVRALLRSQSKLSWVIVSTGIFTSFIFEPMLGIVNAQRDAVMGLGSWENRITATGPDDIGRVVAEIALKHPDVNGIVYTAGSTVSMREIADVVDEVVGKKAIRSVRTVEELENDLAADPDDAMKKYRIVFAGGKGTAWDKSATFNARHGMETQSVLDWARLHLGR